MISTKGRYALRVMLDLARQEKGEYIPLHDIARRQEISEKYLEIIIKALVKSRMVKAQRGKGGGYMLTRPAGDYSVWEILNVTEENIAPVACLMENAQECPRKDACRTLPVWEGYERLTKEYFQGIRLCDL